MRTARTSSASMATLLVVVATSIAAVTPAVAGPGPVTGWHAGIEVRAELALHPLRIAGGIELCKLDVTAVADPLGLIDGQHDLDVVAGYAVGATGWRLGGGLRLTTIAVAGGLHWEERLLAGATAPVAGIGRRLRATVGLEASALIVKHGGGGVTDWLSLSVGRTAWEAFDLGVYLRFEYGSRR